MAKDQIENSGWIKLHRKFIQWEWYDDINTKVVFLHLLLTANHKKNKWHGINIERGQKLTSLAHLAQETQLSVRNIRTALIHLKSTGEVTKQSTAKFTLLTVNNYDEYQSSDKVSDKQMTRYRQGSDKVPTTNKNDKKEKNVNNEKKVSKDTISQEYGNPDINKILETIQTSFNLPALDGSIKENRQYAKLLLQKYKDLTIIEKTCELASADSFWHNKITSAKTLYYKFMILASLSKKSHETVII